MNKTLDRANYNANEHVPIKGFRWADSWVHFIHVDFELHNDL